MNNRLGVAIWDGTNSTLITEDVFGALNQTASEKKQCKYRNKKKLLHSTNMSVYNTLAHRHRQFFRACIELKYTNHFSALRQEIKGIWVTQKPFVHLWATPKVSLNNKGFMFFFACGDWKKKSEGDIWTEVSLWKMIPCRLAEGAGMSWNWRARCWLNSAAHSSLYLSGILLPHFNSHSSLKSPLRCRSHFLWFVF